MLLVIYRFAVGAEGVSDDNVSDGTFAETEVNGGVVVFDGFVRDVGKNANRP